MRSRSRQPKTHTSLTLKTSAKSKVTIKNHLGSMTRDIWTPSAQLPKFRSSMETRESSNTEDIQSSNSHKNHRFWKLHSSWFTVNCLLRINSRPSMKSKTHCSIFIQSYDPHYAPYRCSINDEVFPIWCTSYGYAHLNNRRILHS